MVVRLSVAAFLAALGILLLFVGGADALGGVPRASAGCNPNRGNDGNTYVAGTYRSPGYQVGGVYSSIWNYPDPYTYGSIGYSEQYVGVRTNSTLKAWIGWSQWDNVGGGTERWTYVYWKASSSSAGQFFKYPPDPQWNHSYYTVLHNRNNPGTLTFQVHGTTIKTVNNVLWIPYRGDAFGESYPLASQMPGDPNNISDMNDTNIWTNGAWRSFDGTNTFTPPYHYAYGSGKNYAVEDLGCSS